MIEELAQLVPFTQELLWAGFVVFLRVSSVVSMAPGFGEQSVPVRVKLAIAAAFTLIVTPIVADRVLPPPEGLPQIIGYLGPEILTGLLFGLALRFFVFALQIAGSIAAQSTSLAQIFGGTAGADPQPAIGHVLVVAGLALAALMGLHVHIAAYILQSYAMVPIGVLIAPDAVVVLGVGEVSRVFALGFQLSAPFLIASLIYNVTLGVINRAMPQLMVSFVGAPAITAGGLLLLMLSAPILLSIWIKALSAFMAMPFEGAG